MPICDQKRRTLRPAWGAGVCLLLIAVLLYNPFVGLCRSADSPSYEKLARNRATVGSSELQHFSPVPTATGQPVADVGAIGAELAKVAGETCCAMVQQDVIPGRPEFFAGVWFRPPPTQ